MTVLLMAHAHVRCARANLGKHIEGLETLRGSSTASTCERSSYYTIESRSSVSLFAGCSMLLGDPLVFESASAVNPPSLGPKDFLVI